MGMAMQSLRLREIQILLIREIVIFTTLDKGLSVFMAKPGRAHPIVQVHLICAAIPRRHSSLSDCYTTNMQFLIQGVCVQQDGTHLQMKSG